MKRFFILIAGIVLTLSVFAESLPACIDNVWYMLDTENLVAVVISRPEIKGINISFINEKKITKVEIPSEIKYYPSALEDKYMVCSVIGIGDKAYYGNTDIKEVVLPEGIGFIGDYAFAECKALKKIVIPFSVKEIGEYAFANCKKLRTVQFKNSLGAQARNKSWFVGTKATIESVLMPDESISIP